MSDRLLLLLFAVGGGNSVRHGVGVPGGGGCPGGVNGDGGFVLLLVFCIEGKLG